MRIGFSIRFANSVLNLRMSIPIEIGIIVIPVICMIVSRMGNWIVTLVSAPKYSKAYERIKGMVKTHTILAIAVKVTDNAIFPLQTCVIKLLVGPPGQVARIINPTAIIGLRLKAMASEKPIIGKNISWLLRPIKMALGFFRILVKSESIKVIPIPSIIMARDKGKNNLLIISAAVIAWVVS